MNLKTRVLLLVAALVWAGIWGLATHVSRILQAEIEYLVSSQLSAQARYVADELDEELQLRANLLKEIAGAITLQEHADTARVQSLLDRGNPSRITFPLGLLVLDKDGVIVADHPPVPSARRTGSFSDREYFRAAMAGKRPVIGRPMLLRRISPQPVIPITVPLRDANGSFAGTLLGPVLSSDHDLFGKLEEIRVGRSGQFMVVSPGENRIVFATSASPMNSLPPKGVNRIHDRRLYEGFEGPAITTNPDGVEVIGVSRNMGNTGWVLIAYMTTEEAFAPIRAFKNHTYFAALLVSLAAALILYFVVRRQLLPLDEAGTEMQHMTEGKEPFAPIRVGREDEIGRLVSSFNRLVVERQRTESDIRELNRTLEDRVRERTDQLIAANLQLKTEIGERKLAEASAVDYANRLQHLTRRVVHVLETEQKRLAIELHDRVSSNLTAIGLNLGMITKQLSRDDTAKLEEQLSDCAALLEDTSVSARDISSDLHPPVLDHLGLIPALEGLGEKVGRRTNIAVRVAAPNHGTRLPAEREIALFRIAQEALLNCAKHSQARTVTIQLDCDSNRILFSIADDGIGFDTLEINRPGQSLGLGLLSMQERAEAVGGRCHIESTPGKGTMVSVEMSL